MQKWKLFKVGGMSGFPFCLSIFSVNVVEILFSQQDEFYKNKTSIIAYKSQNSLAHIHSNN